jgi:flagellin-like hook-associated protein FlgL
MSRISGSFGGLDLWALSSLSRAYGRLNESSLRLSTLWRINRGSDDPSGLIAAEAIRAELTAIDAATRSTARAGATIDVVDSSLGVVSDLFNTIRDNVLEASGGNLTEAQEQANQLEIDAALEAIDRIGATTGLGGQDLLDGSTLSVLVGPQPGDVASVTLPHLHTSELGDSTGTLADLRSGGSASLASGDHSRAIDLLDAASSHVLEDRARLGAFQRFTLDSSQEVLASTAVNLSFALSHIRDTDVALETARLVQGQIFVQSSLAAVGFSMRRGVAAGLLGSALSFGQLF